VPDRFSVCRVRNQKAAGRIRRLKIPSLLVAILIVHWRNAGEPSEGPVFPDTAGERRGKMSHARGLRRDLRHAFGIDAWGPKGRGGDGWRKVREPTPRERQLLEGDEHTLPVDWHSWRRSFSQALADSGLNEQAAMGLTGHASEAAHRRYLRNAGRLRELPAGALPEGFGAAVPLLLGSLIGVGEAKEAESLEESGRPQRDLNACYRRERPMS